MQDEEKAELTKQSSALRLDLKTWEKAFAAENGGRKPARTDIKQHPEIAAKYREYDNVRNRLSGKIAQPKPEVKGQTPKKRKHEDRHSESSKRQQIDHTPSRGLLQPWQVDPYESPSVIRNLFASGRKTVLGPTPQKDGQVLGLFDLLQDSGAEPTPSKKENLKPSQTHITHATPSKSRQVDTLKHSRTPASASKRYLLDAFATPSKNKLLHTPGGRTPSSVSKLHFSTPSFLRRDSQRIHKLPALNENDMGPALSPEMIRVPRKPLVRGLSSMLASLRKLEEEAADDDLEALHEMENEMAGIGTISAPKQKHQPKSNPVDAVDEDEDALDALHEMGNEAANSSRPLSDTKPKSKHTVEDNQTGLLGGFDDIAAYDSAPEDPKGRDGQPLKIYKKKGQKRTTRRVNMRPVRSKPSENPIPADEDSDDELAGDEVVAETQIVDGDSMSGFADARNFDSDSQSEYTASEGGTRYRRPDQSKKRKVMGRNGKIKTAARKVTALANQNFKRLKLRNSGAKGGVAHNSRFRRKK
ncbi:DNA replication/checkpoint protein [Tricladium varicosporioides]|nr:DNA replication/checkpoint protein [Hymenoscyphus varicosporioides]